MFWWGGPGWLFGLGNAIFWVALIVVAVLLLRRELPHVRWPESQPPALRLLEERYARGEISREEFLERRRVLLESYPSRGWSPPPPPPTPPPRPEPPPGSPTVTQPGVPSDPPGAPDPGPPPPAEARLEPPPAASPWLPWGAPPGSESPGGGEPTEPLPPGE